MTRICWFHLSLMVARPTPHIPFALNSKCPRLAHSVFIPPLLPCFDTPICYPNHSTCLPPTGTLPPSTSVSLALASVPTIASMATGPTGVTTVTNSATNSQVHRETLPPPSLLWYCHHPCPRYLASLLRKSGSTSSLS